MHRCGMKRHKVEVQWRCCGGGDEIIERDDDGSGEVQRKRAGGCVKKRCR